MMDPKVVLKGLADAKRIAEGYIPTEQDLSGAPVMTDWLIEEFGGLQNLVGYGTGHPTIPDGIITTSALLAMDEEAGWARTVSRYYRLGPRLRITPGEPRDEPPLAGF